jgi:hypothetical protein
MMRQLITTTAALCMPAVTLAHPGHKTGLLNHAQAHLYEYLLLALLVGAVAVTVRHFLKRRV